MRRSLLGIVVKSGMRRQRILSLASAAWFVVAICAGVKMPAAADQNDPRLVPLFSALKSAPTTEAARPIEETIWQVWANSGDPTVDTLMAEGVARLNIGDNDAALALFDQVVKLTPAFAEGWNKRATTLYTMGRFEESVGDIDKVLALEPRHFGALSGLGMCDIRLGKEREAFAAFQRAASVDPNLPGVQANIEALKKRLVKDSI